MLNIPCDRGQYKPGSGSSVIATDGEMGSIRNFLFDDQRWTIGYLVIDVEIG